VGGLGRVTFGKTISLYSQFLQNPQNLQFPQHLQNPQNLQFPQHLQNLQFPQIPVPTAILRSETISEKRGEDERIA
ncbi:MAG: hypothetical protein SAK42_22075, partial [Oscillatoria sp. PMC 1076.18]|nr:hypothetical protein [Oscillatoria sp. PMC 1076.18]